MLQCVAARCSVLQCVAVCCSVLHCSVLQCVAVCCSVLQCVALQCVAVCCSVFQCVSIAKKSHLRRHNFLYSRTAKLNYPASAGLNHQKSGKRGVRGVSSAIAPFLNGMDTLTNGHASPHQSRALLHRASQT